MVYPPSQADVFQRMVSKYEFAASRGDDIEMRRANQVFEIPEVCLVGLKIIALRLEPETLESHVVDEYVRGAGSIGSILKIEVAPIQRQGVAIGIERERRKSPVVMVHDQFSIRRFEKYLRQRPRRQKWIEHHQGQPSGVVEQNHHQRGCQERGQIGPSTGW